MKTLTLPKLKSKVWDQFSLYIRLRDAKEWLRHHPEYNGEPMAACVTCRKPYPIKGPGCLQAGHFIPGRKNVVLFDEDQVNSQCWNCNYRLNGNWPAYYEFMVAKHGALKVQEMLDNRHTILKFNAPQLEMLLDHYKKLCQQIEAEL
jgi:hypothetical protein